MQIGSPRMLMQSYGDKSGIAIEPILGGLTGHLAYPRPQYREIFRREKPHFAYVQEAFRRSCGIVRRLPQRFVCSIMVFNDLGGEHFIYRTPGVWGIYPVWNECSWEENRAGRRMALSPGPK